MNTADPNNPEGPAHKPVARINWDKIIHDNLFNVFALVITAIVGFFSGRWGVEDKINTVSERVARVETANLTYDNKLRDLDNALESFELLEKRLKTLEIDEDSSRLLRKMLDDHLQTSLERTTATLRTLIQELKK